jgi:multidrug efflux pump subunit AcrA (membrane-fusion protein)
MTNKRITELTALDGDDVADNDVLAIVDVSDTTMAASGTTKKITVAELVTDSALTNKFWPNSTTALTGANLANGDKLAVVDVGSPDVAKYITADQLAQGSQFSTRYASTTNFPSGVWTAWTPTVTSETGTITTVGALNCAYVLLGKTLMGRISIAITTKGTAAGKMNVTLPSGISLNAAQSGGACGNYREFAATGAQGVIWLNYATTLVLMEFDGTTPFNADGENVSGTFMFEVE